MSRLGVSGKPQRDESEAKNRKDRKYETRIARSGRRKQSERQKNQAKDSDDLTKVIHFCRSPSIVGYPVIQVNLRATLSLQESDACGTPGLASAGRSIPTHFVCFNLSNQILTSASKDRRSGLFCAIDMDSVYSRFRSPSLIFELVRIKSGI